MARVSFRLQKSTGGAGLRNDTSRTFVEAGAIDTGVSATTLTVTGGDFWAADVGASITVTGAGAAAADLVTTIDSVTSSTVVELTDAASTTVTDADVIIISDDTDGLRADSLQVAPAEALSGDIFFEAVSSCYGEIDLTWDLPLVSISASPGPTQYVVVYSPFGPPETVSAGEVIAEGFSGTEFVHMGLPEGKFAYYTLFVRYQSTAGDDYYEPLARLEEIVPRNYGSTLDMWERIPDYYRTRDVELGTPATADLEMCLGFPTYGEPVGPLLKFLSVFGFEMDRVRTLAAHVSLSKDPRVADTSALQYLAEELATLIDIDALGAGRLRALLDSIGVFRRIKGTDAGVEYFVRSLSGSVTQADEATRTIEVDSGRVNYIRDPLNTKVEVDIESTQSAIFGEAESPAFKNTGAVSSSLYPQSNNLIKGQFVAAAPNFNSVGTMNLGGLAYGTGVTEVPGPLTYTGTADPDVTVPDGHMFAVNDDSSNAANYYGWSIGLLTDFDLANQGGAITWGAVFSVTDATPAADTNIFRVGTAGGNDHVRLVHTTGSAVRVSFRTADGTVTTGGAFTPTLDTMYYGIGYIDPTWENITLKVYDSTGLVFTDVTALGAHAGVWEPGDIITADHAGGVEMVHSSTGTHAELTWLQADAIAAEWMTNTRSPGAPPALEILHESTEWASTPDSDDTSPAGSFSLVFHCKLTATTTTEYLGAKYATSNYVWYVGRNSSNQLALAVSTTGASYDVGGTTTFTVPDDTEIWLGMTYYTATGELKGWYSYNGHDWVGETVDVGGAGNPYAASTAPTYIGSLGTTDTSHGGEYYSWEYYAGMPSPSSTPGAGTLTANFNAADFVIAQGTGDSATSAEGQVWTLSGSTGMIVASSLFTSKIYGLSSDVFVNQGDLMSFSVHSNVGVNGNIAWARMLSAGGNVIGYSDLPSERFGVPYFDMIVSETSPGATVEFMVYDDSIFGNFRYLLEKNGTGPYFDGSTTRGGWIFSGGTSISDFRWEGTVHNSRSLYSEDFRRTQVVVDDLYEDVLPVHQLNLWNVTYNNIP